MRMVDVKLGAPTMTPAMLEHLRYQLRMLLARRSGEGMRLLGWTSEVFSLGGDLDLVLAARSESELQRYASLCLECGRMALAVPGSTVAVLPEGTLALGGGAEAALTCDRLERPSGMAADLAPGWDVEYAQGHFPFLAQGFGPRTLAGRPAWIVDHTQEWAQQVWELLDGPGRKRLEAAARVQARLAREARG